MRGIATSVFPNLRPVQRKLRQEEIRLHGNKETKKTLPPVLFAGYDIYGVGKLDGWEAQISSHFRKVCYNPYERCGLISPAGPGNGRGNML